MACTRMAYLLILFIIDHIVTPRQAVVLYAGDTRSSLSGQQEAVLFTVTRVLHCRPQRISKLMAMQMHAIIISLIKSSPEKDLQQPCCRFRAYL